MVPQNVRLLNRNKPEESGQMHTQEQERTQKDVENEDLLINQIDESVSYTHLTLPTN